MLVSFLFVAIIEGGIYASAFEYDEAGNVLASKVPGLEPTRMSYDSRGLPLVETPPTGAQIRRIYDELGNLRQYIDEQGEVTHYDIDSIGRTFRVRYSDGTREEVRFEEGTGVVLATRDRAGQWFWFKYDSSSQRVVEEHLGGTGDEPSFIESVFTRYRYDDAARLTRITQAEAAIEYAEFDLMGRPGITRSIRFTKVPCAPATLPCGTGLTSGEIAEVYTQGHEWSVFESERERWRMPAAGASLPVTEATTSWRNWIVEKRDGAGNLAAQQEALSAAAPPDGPLLSASVARGIGRLSERRRGQLTNRFGYSDIGADGTSPVVPVVPPSPGPAIGSLGRAEILRGGLRIAGSEVLLDAKRLIGDSDDLGLASRTSSWNYDGRARLESSELLRDPVIPVGVPGTNDTVLASDFRSAREISPLRLGAAEYEALGLMAKTVVPLTWVADAPAAGNQLTKRTFAHGSIPEGEESFAFTGGRRTAQGTSRFSYDPRGRLVAHEMLAAGRRIVYAYDPNDRMIGRTAFRLTGAGTWILEDRTNVLARDGLPADSTFIWDPLVDRLVAIYQANTPQTSAEAGLIRQYLHGDQGYDDPIDVLIASQAGSPATPYLPIVDHAGTGSLQAVADAQGYLVERVLYADSYGDAPRHLHGAVVERITITNDGSARTIRVELSEAFDVTTLAAGATLAAVGTNNSVLRTSGSPVPSESGSSRAFEWKLSEAEWSALISGASAVEVSIGSVLRFVAWGDRPLQETSSWEVSLGRATSSSAAPFIKRIAIDATGEVYAVPDLYLVAKDESKSKLLFDFHSLPFRDPASGLSYARARWLDNTTGQFVTPDPMGYEDSSSLYQYAGNDPVNLRDPSGEFVNHAVGGAVSVGLGWGIATLMKQDYTWTDAAIDFGIGAATSGLSSIDKIAKLGRLRRLATVYVPLDVSAEIIRYEAKGEDYELKEIGFGALRNFLIGEAGAAVGRKLFKRAPITRPNDGPPSPIATSTTIESRGARAPLANGVVARSRTSRSLVTSVRASVGEAQAYGRALTRGEIGLQRPGVVNASGPDFITAVRDSLTGQYRILVTDVKVSTRGVFPRNRSNIPTAWGREVEDAISLERLILGNPILEQHIRNAFAEGRVFRRHIHVDYSAAGQGRVSGF